MINQTVKQLTMDADMFVPQPHSGCSISFIFKIAVLQMLKGFYLVLSQIQPELLFFSVINDCYDPPIII